MESLLVLESHLMETQGHLQMVLLLDLGSLPTDHQ